MSYLVSWSLLLVKVAWLGQPAQGQIDNGPIASDGLCTVSGWALPGSYLRTLDARFDCLECPPGTYQPLYNNRYNITSCLPCQPGSFTFRYGSLACESCAEGFYSDKEQQVACQRCPPGSDILQRYLEPPVIVPPYDPRTPFPYESNVSSANTTKCYQCPAGAVNFFFDMPYTSNFKNLSTPFMRGATAEGQVDNSYTAPYRLCSYCPWGFAVNLAGVCGACPAGTARGNPNIALDPSGGCNVCPAGSYSKGTSRVDYMRIYAGDSTILSPGVRSQPDTTLDVPPFVEQLAVACQACPFGHWSEPGASECTKCPANTQAVVVDSAEDQFARWLVNNTLPEGTSVDEHTDYQFFDTIACVACPAGSWSAPGSGSCLTSGCPSGYIVQFEDPSNSSSPVIGCEICPAGTYRNYDDDPTTCIPCDLGLASPAGSYGCQYPCTPGTGSIPGQPNCEPCAKNYYNPGGLGQRECGFCGFGAVSQPGSEICDYCQNSALSFTLGTFVYTPDNTCQSCNQFDGAMSVHEFVSPFTAPSRYLDENSVLSPWPNNPVWEPCGDCVNLGQETQVTRWGTCSICPPGQSRPKGSEVCVPCGPGSHRTNKTDVGCALCPEGTFADGYGTAICTPCPTGLGTDGKIGQTECTACPIGTYSDGSSEGGCTPCPAGTNNPFKGNTECYACPAGSFSAEGAWNCKACSAGSFSAAGSPSCSDRCPANMYVDFGIDATYGFAGCRSCPPGRWTKDQPVPLDLNSTDDELCICEKCPEGTWSGSISSSCLAPRFACPTDEVFLPDGAGCRKCPINSVPDNTHTLCLTCPTGSYQFPGVVIKGSNGEKSAPRAAPGTASAGFRGDGVLVQQEFHSHLFGSTPQESIPKAYTLYPVAPTFSTTCLPCLPGDTQTITGGGARRGDFLGKCTTCPAGMFSIVRLIGDLPAGHDDCFTPDLNTVICNDGNFVSPLVLLPSGNFSTLAWGNAVGGFASTSECQWCPLGQAHPGNGVCSNCAEGSIIRPETPSVCGPLYNSGGEDTCPNGQVIVPTILSYGTVYVCTNVPAGSYLDTLNGTVMSCANQTWSRPGQLACTPGGCPAGSEPAAGGSLPGQCSLCPAGKYSDEDGSQVPCKVPSRSENRIVPWEGYNGYVTCVNGTRANENQTRCDMCADVAQVSSRAPNAACHYCPAGWQVTTLEDQQILGSARQFIFPGDNTTNSTPGPIDTSPFGINGGATLSPLAFQSGETGSERNLRLLPYVQSGDLWADQIRGVQQMVFQRDFRERVRTVISSGAGSLGSGLHRFSSALASANARAQPVATANPTLLGSDSDAGVPVVGCTGSNCDPGMPVTNYASAWAWMLPTNPRFCVECGPGQFKSDVSALSCSWCPAGTTTLDYGSTSCGQCPAGFYNPGVDAAVSAAVRDVFADEQGQDPSASTAGTETEWTPAQVAAELGAFWLSQVSGVNFGTSTAPGFAGAVPSLSKNGPGDIPDFSAIAVPVQLDCVACPAGTWADARHNGTCCSLCGPGTFSASPGSTQCETCPGITTSGWGAQECIFNGCPAGFREAGIGVCEACPAGTYSVAGSDKCGPCPVGTSTGGLNTQGHGIESCSACPAGMFASAPGSPTCSNCSAGTDSARRLVRNGCDACVPPNATEGGGVPCHPCVYPSFVFDSGTKCYTCPAGFERDDNPSDPTYPCHSCHPGSYSSKGECVECRAPLGTVASASKSSLDCVPCSDNPGEVFSQNTETCVSCPPGYTGGGWFECTQCLVGTTPANRSSWEDRPFCESCPLGTQSTWFVEGTPQAELGLCVPCAPGLVGTGRSPCLSCAQFGFGIPTADQGACVDCPLGEYSPDALTCELCPDGYGPNQKGGGGTRSLAGATLLDRRGEPCTPCPGGTYRRNHSSTGYDPVGPLCEICPAGLFRPADGLIQVGCLPCPSVPGFTSSPDRRNCLTTCPNGTIWKNDTFPVCEACPQGLWSGGGAATTCVGCGPGTELDPNNFVYPLDPEQEFQVACRRCLSLTVNPAPSGGICAPCPAGSAAISPTECQNCSALGNFYPRKNNEGFQECAPCPAGTDLDPANPGRCFACAAGHIFNVTAGSCQSCPLGYYVDLDSISVDPATGGKFYETCLPCPGNTFLDTVGQLTCVACPAGKHAPGRGNTACIDCPGGYISDGLGGKCTQCPAYSNNGAECTICPAGQGGVPNSDSCHPCEEGTITAPGVTEGLCGTCPPGRFETNNHTHCESCGVLLPWSTTSGGYKPPSAPRFGALSLGKSTPGTADACQLCPDGMEPIGPDTFGCVQCRPGFASSSVATQGQCVSCEVATGSNISAAPGFGSISCRICNHPGVIFIDPATECQRCPRGLFNLGDNTCSSCPAGHRFSPVFPGGMTCVECADGHFMDPAISNTSCQQCPSGVSNANHTGCLNCTGNTFSRPGAISVCTTCPFGQGANQDHTACQTCPDGEEPNTVTWGCRDCVNGWFTPGSNGSQVCQPCDAGFESLPDHTDCVACQAGEVNDPVNAGPGGSVCTGCSVGHQADGDQRLCSLCPDGQFSAGGTTPCAVCIDGSTPTANRGSCELCPVGFQGETGGVCVRCTDGEHPTANHTACEPCPPTMAGTNGTCAMCPDGSVPNANRTGCDACAPSTGVDYNDPTSCTACGPGTYSDGNGICRACVGERVGVNSAQTACVNCSANEAVVDGECWACGDGNHLGLGQQCTACPAGQVGTGGYCPTFCQPGQQADANRTGCESCPAGTRSSDGTGCSACPPGSFSNAAASDCIYCGPGETPGPVNASDPSSPIACLACPTGSVSGGFGTDCYACQAGTEPNNGATGSACVGCPSGWANGEDQAGYPCEPCQEGHIPSTSGVGCTACEVGGTTNGPGQTTCLYCGPGETTDQNGTCVLCEPGTAWDGVGGCLACTGNDVTTTAGSLACGPCGPGRGPTANNSQCLLCTDNTYSLNGVCVACGAGTWPTEDRTSCRPCLPGFALGSTPGTCAPCLQDTASSANRLSCEPCGNGSVAYASIGVPFTGELGGNGGGALCIACPTGQQPLREVTPGAGWGQCTDCPAGSSSHAGICSLCADGWAAEAGGPCLECQIGQEVNAARSSCELCPAGKFSDRAASEDCSDCGPGETSLDDRSGCYQCPSGWIGTGTGECLQCGAGEFADAVSGTCKACPSAPQPGVPNGACVFCGAGSEPSTTNASECSPCSANTFSPGSGTPCLPCPRGQVPSSPSSCGFCAAGQQADPDTGVTCTACPKGSVRPDGNSTAGCFPCGPGQGPQTVNDTLVCRDCDEGTTSTGNGICGPCADGQQPGTQPGSCDDCPAGQANSPGYPGQRCELCSPGYVPTPDLAQCVPCLPGTFWQNWECLACSSNQVTSAPGLQECRPCEPGFEPTPGLDSCSPCEPNEISDGLHDCHICGAGQEPSADRSGCVLCAADRVAVAGQSQCTTCPNPGTVPNAQRSACDPCPTGTRVDSSAPGRCVRCGPGQEVVGAGLPCSDCAAGTFSSGFGQCVSPPLGFYVNGTGATDFSVCAEGKTPLFNQTGCTGCDPGSVSAGGGAPCQPCANGFEADPTQQVCVRCASNEFSEGGAVCAACRAGTTPIGDGSSCRECSTGLVGTVDGTCETCPAGQRPNATDNGCEPCPIGFAGTTTAGVCSSCFSVGAIQPLAGQTACTQCGVGREPTSINATACDFCSLGHYNPLAAGGRCVACPAGTGSDSARDACAACPAGQWSSTGSGCQNCGTGQGSNADRTGCGTCLVTEGFAVRNGVCALCDDGFQPLANGTGCEECPAGTAGTGGLCHSCNGGQGSQQVQAFFQVIQDPSQPQINGQFASSTGQTTCSDCPAGHGPSEDGKSCVPCVVGHVSPAGTPGRCTACLYHTAPDATNSSCKPCSSAEIWDTALFTCSVCPSGQQPDPAFLECTDCPVGKAGTNGACSACLPGQGQSLDRQTCKTCKAGTFSTAGACIPCPVNLHSAADGATGCTRCPAGRHTEGQAVGAASCAACPTGTAKTADAYVCSACGPGTNPTTPVASTCEVCEEGTQSTDGSPCDTCAVGSAPNAAGTDCVQCSLSGQYAEPGFASCQNCDPGSQPNAAGTACLQCSPGFYSLDGSACLPCQGELVAPDWGAVACAACPVGRLPHSENTACVNCPSGQFSPERGTACSFCPFGTQPVSATNDTLDSSFCVGCPAGHWSQNGLCSSAPCQLGTQPNPESAGPLGGDPCQACPADVNPVSPGSCIGCANGEQLVGGTCTPCSPGSAGINGNCPVCAVGTYQALPGQTSCDLVPEGAQSTANRESFDACPDGSYRPAGTLGACQTCEPGTTATGPQPSDHVSCSPCGAGKAFVASSEGLSLCAFCADGLVPNAEKTTCVQCTGQNDVFAFDVNGDRTCSPCGAGTQPDSTHENCLDCDPGFFATASTVCTGCATGFFAPSSGSASCTVCGIGTFPSTDRDVCDKCDPGKYSPGILQGCLTCEPNFAPSPQQGECLACGDGQVALPGDASCSLCPVGKQRDPANPGRCAFCSSGQVTLYGAGLGCFPCPAGQYAVGTTSCANCDPGYFTSRDGLTSCTPCSAPGAYSTGSGEAACSICQAGTQVLANRSGCEVCPTGRVSALAGDHCTACQDGNEPVLPSRTGCEACGPNSAGTGGTCSPCAAGQLPDQDRKHCVGCTGGTCRSDCPSGSEPSAVTANACTLCPSGFYGPGGNQTCAPCGPMAHTAGATGAASCTQCSFGQQAALTSCVSCSPGRFSDGPSGCQPAPPGTRPKAPVADGVVPCAAGTASLGDSATCTDCPRLAAGPTGSAEGAVVCRLCGINEELVNNATCAVCSLGRFAKPIGPDGGDAAQNGRSCEPCPVGTAGGGYQSTCAPCHTGFFTFAEGASVCSPCPKWQTSNADKSDCVHCVDLPGRSNTYNPVGGGQCLACPAGSQSNAGRDCELCPEHQYSTGSDDTGCQLCSVEGETSLDGLTCTQCPFNTGFRAGFPGRCFPCQPGEYSAAGKCLPCPKGKTSDGNGLCYDCAVNYGAESGTNPCQACAPGFERPLGQPSCSACVDGLVSPGGGISCFQCAAGEIAVSATSCASCAPTQVSQPGSTACSECQPGTHPDSDRASCIACPAGKATLGAPGDCVSCAAGEESNANRTACDTCPAGTFSDGVKCQTCAPGLYTPNVPAAMCEECAPGEASPNGIDCVACVLGSVSYPPTRTVLNAKPPTSDNGWVNGCAECLPGFFPNTARTACEVCPPGSVTPPATTGGGVLTPGGGSFEQCLPCIGATYPNPAPGAYDCIPCETGTSPADGICISCGPGQEASRSPPFVCVDCEPGFFLSAAGALAGGTCQSCPVGHVSETPGSTACVPCGTGQEPINGNSACQRCAAGLFRDPLGDEPVCRTCPLGKRPTADQGGCTFCPRGSVGKPTEPGVCQVCALGQWPDPQAATPESATCVSCPLGYIAASPGFCTACPAGEEPDPLDTDPLTQTCKSCATGEFSAQPGSTCLECPAGTFNMGSLAVTCGVCNLGQEPNTGTAPGASACSPCEANEVSRGFECVACVAGSQPALSNSVCDLCPAGQAFGEPSHVNECSDCPVNTQPSDDRSRCQTCESGRYSPSGSICQVCGQGQEPGTGAAKGTCVECTPGSAGFDGTCTACGSGFYQASAGAPVCNSCPAGSEPTLPSGSRNCTACATGRFSPGGVPSCTRCPLFHQPTANGQACVACGSNQRYNEAAGTCHDCPSGTRVNLGGTDCDPCPGGSCSVCPDGWTPNPDLGQYPLCVPCAIDFYGVDGSCLPCGGLGSFTTGVNATSCLGASAGHQSSQAGGEMVCPDQTATNGATVVTVRAAGDPSGCAPCPPGSAGDPSDHVSCHACSSGRAGSDGTCSICAAGTTGNSPTGLGSLACVACLANERSTSPSSGLCSACGDGEQPLDQAAGTCEPCPAGTAGTAGFCTQCPVHTHPNDEKDACELCEPGHYVNADQTGCVPCDAGEWSNGGEPCQPCGSGLQPDEDQGGCQRCGNQQWSVSGGLCQNCSAGHVSVDAGSDCVSCSPFGRVVDGRCEPCPGGTQPSSDGTGCENCDPGFVSPDSTSVCVACESGYVQPLAGQTTCEACGIGRFGDGGITCSLCPVGTFQPSVGGTRCVTCPAGSESLVEGAGECTSCPAGQKSTGGGTCSVCAPGTAPNEARTDCVPCAAGLFSPDGDSCRACPSGERPLSTSGSASCVPCQPGTAGGGVSGACAPCVDETFSDAEGLGACLTCGVGHRAQANHTGCQPCDAQQWTIGYGQSCANCPVGQFPVPDQSACAPCPIGRLVVPLVGDTAPLDSSVLGVFVSPGLGVSALTTDRAEALNLYCPLCATTKTPNANRTSCVDCPSGSTPSRPGICVACQAGHGPDNDHDQGGSGTTCARCPQGTAGTDGTCQVCEAHSFTDGSGGQTCLECPAGWEGQPTLPGDAGPVGCLPCEDGWASGLGQACYQCPSGQGPVPDQSSCDPCPEGSVGIAGVCRVCGVGEQPNAQQTACVPCAADTTAAGNGTGQCTSCGPGLVPNAESSECRVCPAGEYENQALAPGLCLPCPPGQFSSQPGSATCESCQPGSVPNSTNGATGCTACTDAEGISNEFYVECLRCPLGTEPASGNTECQQCLPNQIFNASSGQCADCPAGQRPNGQGDSCGRCPTFTYLQDYATARCAVCDPGQEPTADHAGCTACLPGSESTDGGHLHRLPTGQRQHGHRHSQLRGL